MIHPKARVKDVFHCALSSAVVSLASRVKPSEAEKKQQKHGR
jgi:hypothetical protein